MNLRRLAVVVCAAVLATAALVPAPAQAENGGCTTPATPLTGARKILIAGDSVTTGTVGDYTWRYFLWQQLAGTAVDFVGPATTVAGYQADVNGPNLDHDYAACDFDWNYLGNDGLKFSDFNANGSYSIKNAATTYGADAVVALLGFNELNANESVTDVLADAHQFVLNIQAARPDADVVLATEPGPLQYGEFAQALDDDAPAWSVAGHSTVVVADLPSWAAHTWDGWHPDGQGDAGIGEAMAAALHEADPAYYPAASPAPTDVAIGPQTPAVLAAPSKPSDNAVGLTWTLPPEADRTIVNARDLTTGGGWVTVADLVLTAYKAANPDLGFGDSCFIRCTSVTIKNLVAGDQYEFQVTAAKGYSVPDVQSNVVSAIPSGTPPPPPPAKVAAPTTTSLEHAVKLTWAAVANATGYQVRWKPSASSTWSTPTAASNAITRTVAGLPPGVRYDFQVRATGSTVGDWSDLRSAAARAYALKAPAKPRTTALAGHRIRATWTAVAHATRYLVQVRLGATFVKSVFVTKPTWTSGALVKRKTYKVTVRPYDGAYGGGTSAAGSIKTK